MKKFKWGLRKICLIANQKIAFQIFIQTKSKDYEESNHSKKNGEEKDIFREKFRYIPEALYNIRGIL